MRIIIFFIMLLMSFSLVYGFRMETVSYSVNSTNTGIVGSNVDTSSYAARFFFEEFYPASNGESTLYFLHPGYFESAFNIVLPMNIVLIDPVDGAYLNSNVTFSYNVTTNGTLNSCNLLVYQNGSLTVNDSDAVLSNFSFGPYNLPEDFFTWHVECLNGLGNISSSSINSFIVDKTLPIATIVVPLNNVTVYNNFTFSVTELHPSYLVIDVDGTNYSFNYTGGVNVFSPILPQGYHSYTVNFFDLAGNNNLYGPFNFQVNNNVVAITNVHFEPSQPITIQDTNLLATVSGGFSTVVVSVFTNSTGWNNYTVFTYSGTGPFTYVYTLDKSNYVDGDIIRQQWSVLDNLSIWRQSGIYTATVRKRTTGSGGSFPEVVNISGSPNNLILSPSPLQITSLNGIIFTVQNNNSVACELSNVHIIDTFGSTDLQDRFKVQMLDTTNLSIAPGDSLSLQIKPTGIKGIVGNGRVVVDSVNCGSVTDNLGVQIFFTDNIIDNINSFTANIIDFINNLITELGG